MSLFIKTLMCEVLGVSRSGYYRWLPLRGDLKEKQNMLNSVVLESWTDSYKLYGSRRIAKDKGVRGIFFYQRIRFFYNETS